MNVKKCICKVCEKKFEEKNFDVEQNKCILHCEKAEINEWYTDKKYKTHWNPSKINNFWAYLKQELDALYQSSLTDEDYKHRKKVYEKVIFPKFQQEILFNPHAWNTDEMGTNFYSFDVFTDINKGNDEQAELVNQIIEKLDIYFINCTFLDTVNFEKYNFKKRIVFKQCDFKNQVLLNKKNDCNYVFAACNFNLFDLNLSYSTFNSLSILKCINIGNLNLKESTFKNKVKIQSCTIEKTSNFYNTKFMELADFYRTKFNDVIFERTDFIDISIFSETVFSKPVDFKYTKFLGKTIFRDTIFADRLNLRNTIFDDDALFLDITIKKGTTRPIKIENRETARVIKNFLDNSNNIIEANKFYALEMKEMEKELQFKKTPFQWLIFKIHGLSSNHSQDPFSAILWIFYISTIASNTNSDTFLSIILFSLFLFIALLVFHIPLRIRNLILLLSVLIIFFFSPITLNSLVNTINSFSHFGNKITFSVLLYKISLAYLFYQFVVSLRQNTRRK